MEKLILKNCYSDGVNYWDNRYCFEYSSKDEFIFDVLEKYKNYTFKKYGSFSELDEEVEIIKDIRLNKYEIDDIERNVFTLEEWFENEKIIVNKIL